MLVAFSDSLQSYLAITESSTVCVTDFSVELAVERFLSRTPNRSAGVTAG